MLSGLKEARRVTTRVLRREKSLLLPRYVLAELQAQKLTMEERPFEPGLEG